MAQLLAEYGTGLWSATAIYAKCPADREDLYQEICFALRRALPTFRGESALRTFVFRIARNRGVTHLRRKRYRDEREVPMAAQ